MMKRETRHRHTGDAGIAVAGKVPQWRPVTSRKVFQNDQVSLRGTGKYFQAGVERLCRPFRILWSARAKVAFARAATDHEGPHGKKVRKLPPDAIDGRTNRSSYAFRKILPHEEEWLDGAHLVLVVLKHDEKMVEFLRQCRARELVETMILAFVAERVLPGWAILQTLERDKGGKAGRNPD